MSHRYARDPRWMTARFPSKCSRCGGSIPKGAPIFYYPNTRAVLCNGQNCGTAAAREFQSIAVDDEFMNSQFSRN